MKLILCLCLFSLSTLAGIKIVGDKIHIADDPNFISKLEVKKFIASGNEAHLRETGFIIASAQGSFENEQFVSRWVALDDSVLKANNFLMSEIVPSKGMAYGVIATSKDFQSELKVGQALLIKRYGLEGDHFQGKITKVIPMNGLDIVQIHFVAFSAPELIAGTTCEVDITHIKKRPFKVSLLSLLHIGLEDYVVIKESDGAYYPKHATIVDQDAETATILVPFDSEKNYVARGAILLKPLLSQIISQQGTRP